MAEFSKGPILKKIKNVLQTCRSRHSSRTADTSTWQCKDKGKCKYKNKCKYKWKTGSLTVEAAWAVPLFFLCVAALICVMNIYGKAAVQTVSLQQQAEKAGIAATVLDSEGESVIDLPIPATYDIHIFPGIRRTIYASCRGRVRVWNGRDYVAAAANTTAQREKLVLVTDNQSVYHLNSSCTHLTLSVRPVLSATVSGLRNSSGSRYHACEKCVGNGRKNGMVYVTSDGDRYHNSETCSGLTRHVRLISEQEADGLHVCSRCAAQPGDSRISIS